ncbi:MAG: hypothetical protein ACRD1M_17635 [Terriglobales bacterium]
MRKLQIATIAVLLSLVSVVGVREVMASSGHASAVASVISAPIPGSK